MVKYALVENGTDKILKVADEKRFRKGTPPRFADKPFRWLPVVDNTPPAHDSETHHAPRRQITVETDRVVRGFTDPVAYTPKEIQDRKRASVPAPGSIEFKLWFPSRECFT